MGERITTDKARELLVKSTPGPWRAFNDGADGDPEWTIAKRRDGAVTYNPIADCVYGMTAGNATLIAAAPDLAADLIDAREQIAALTAALDDARNLRGTVTAEKHAQAVRSAAAGNRGHDEAVGPPVAVTLAWFTSDARRDLIATLRAAGVPDARALALVDGDADARGGA